MPIYQVTIDPWFQIYRELEDEAIYNNIFLKTGEYIAADESNQSNQSNPGILMTGFVRLMSRFWVGFNFKHHPKRDLKRWRTSPPVFFVRFKWGHIITNPVFEVHRFLFAALLLCLKLGFLNRKGGVQIFV